MIIISFLKKQIKKSSTADWSNRLRVTLNTFMIVQQVRKINTKYVDALHLRHLGAIAGLRF